jgi:hypothetical protein
MSNIVHNLDDSVDEYFEFILKGHKYKFRHLNTEEMQDFIKLKDDEEKAKKELFKFIEPVDSKDPSFEEVSKTMLVPHWKKFYEMIQVEFIGTT